ncbi:hypothetical protein CspeluHIS016_0305700 [Cutaneotrichosporon spelunceum]|uniref:Uncharacterized protein n=1 Tax=Cutaneotrichosporon spelunceum TaxID=1672016 RepID=A0AAD3TTQ9_9TREE|nr:hypothetical protein CspeluHIS016_0305700 [Cutaneotrichosporon spelunceum]
MFVNAEQVQEVLFGAGKVADKPHSSIIVFSTVPPSFLIKIRERLDPLKKDVGLVDSSVSGGFIQAAEGQLSIMVSGTLSSISIALPDLNSLTLKPNGNLAQPRCRGDTVRQASGFKLINEVLCGIHIAVVEEKVQAAQGGEDVIKIVGDLLDAADTVSTADALAFARHKGMDLGEVFNVVGTSAATSKPLVAFKDELSWPNKLEPQSGQSTVEQILDNLRIVMKKAKGFNTSLCLTQAAQQRFADTVLECWSEMGSSIIGRLWL